MFCRTRNAAFSELDFLHFFVIKFRIAGSFIMMSDEDTDDGNVVGNDRKYRTTTFADRYAIFLAIKSTMVDGHMKSGIQIDLAKLMNLHRGTVSRQWTAINIKLATLLDTDEPEEGEALAHIIGKHSLYLFSDMMSTRKKGKYKYCRNEVAEAIKLVPHKS
jgi:hypothetical protein